MDAGANVQLVRETLEELQGMQELPAAHLAPNFTLRANGHLYDAASFQQMWHRRRERLKEATFEFRDMFSQGDQVAAVRTVSIVTTDGRREPGLTVVDVWRVAGGRVVSGEQCWQRVVQLASDDFPHTPQEGRLEEQVRAALASLQALGRVQPALQQHWAPDYRGRVNGVEMDHAALCRHWAALQERLTTVLVDVKEVVVHSTALGAIFRVLLGRKDGSSVELHYVAVFGLDAAGRLASCQAVCKLASGSVGADELLPRP